MANKLSIFLIEKELPVEEISRVIKECRSEAEISVLTDYQSFVSLAAPVADLVILSYDRGESYRLPGYGDLGHSKVPHLFFVNDPGKMGSDYYQLTLAGAYGFVDPGNIPSLVHYIGRLTVQDFHTGSNADQFNPELLKYIIDSNESMMSVINNDYLYESVNDSFCKNLNCSKEDLIGTSPAKLWGDETFRDIIEKNLRKCLNGEVVRYKAYFDKSGFSGKCYDVIYRPYLQEKSGRKYTIVETREITELENARRIAELSDPRGFYFEKYLPFGIFDCDLNGKILFANETFYNILELPHGSGDELFINSFSPSDHRFSEYLKDINVGESSTFSQLQMLTSKGAEIFARISSHARLNEENEIVVNAILEDTTREVLLERKLSSSHRMETLGTLAGGIAHDFNTILTTISGYSELTMDEVDPDSVVYDYMSKVSKAIKRAESVINQMLTFSRQIDLEKIPVKVSDVLREASDFMKSAIPYNIYLNLVLKSPEQVVMADPTQLFRVFLNIMTNAVQAMEQNGGLLTIELSESMTGEKQYADIRISDTGTGIDRSIIDRIYEPFFTTKDVGKGSGMGLSVSHGIVAGLGGEMNVESSQGVGTIFTVRLPHSGYGNTGTEESGEPLLTIMYADENLFFSRTVSLALERLGYRVFIASSIEDMSLIMSKSRSDIDIYFIRCGFSHEGGEEMVKKIIGDNTESRIVLITKPGSDSYRKIIREERKRISIINEPVSLREILNAINEYC